MNRNTKILRNYYLLTPGFAVADIVFGINVRVSVPGGYETAAYVYYITCFMSSFLLFKTARSAAIFSLCECAINMFLLFHYVLWPWLNLDTNIETGLAQYRFGALEVIHFFIVGGVLLYSFNTNPLISKSSEYKV